MSDAVRFFISVWIKFFFLLTPFFALSMFLSLTADLEAAARRLIALRVTGSVIVACFVLYFFGNSIFYVFGITLDSFRIGAGSLLFLSAVDLVRKTSSAAPLTQDNNDITVVPLAVPIIVGPATTGALLVMGAETQDTFLKVMGCGALTVAVLCVGIMLFMASSIERIVGRRGLNILSKLTGLILSALAAQIVFTGIRSVLLNH
ncbi:MarC family protein [Desulforhabdus amnigena]|jgi:multiple antibiotic resistance protein|uniref:UPF0056 membrane protein n=1 Tax=Desulforhabdus amnigena TaxID=40218 RepID=A0A9W6D5Y4_9BACT|nr:MarC family protein [Desulforhabdus amnigena]NLJ28255.1 NAAT family transporter [Deltaproteobacteria bacterium]GLI34825.1 UPF0056 inner membrane protein [Desulforhabdus amnigena]